MFTIKNTLPSKNLNFSIFRDINIRCESREPNASFYFSSNLNRNLEQNNGKFDYVMEQFEKHYHAYEEQMTLYNQIPNEQWETKRILLQKAND